MKKVYPIKCFNFKIMSHKGSVIFIWLRKGKYHPILLFHILWVYRKYFWRTVLVFLLMFFPTILLFMNTNQIPIENQSNIMIRPIIEFHTYWVLWFMGWFSRYSSNLNCLFDRPVISWYLMCYQLTLSRHANLTDFYRKCALSYFSS